MSDNRVEYSEVEWDRCFAVLEAQCADLSAKVEDTTELLVDCRERLSETLREMSVTKEFAKSGLSTPTRIGTECENGAVGVVQSGRTATANVGSIPAIDSPEVLEAERKLHCQAHRLRLEASERWPGEVE